MVVEAAFMNNQLIDMQRNLSQSDPAVAEAAAKIIDHNDRFIGSLAVRPSTEQPDVPPTQPKPESSKPDRNTRRRVMQVVDPSSG